MEIPERIASRVQTAIADLKWCQDEMERLFNLDSRFGGNGRYESEGWNVIKPRIDQAQSLIDQFRGIASEKGIDVDAVLRAWGGVPTPIRSLRAIFYDMESA